MGARLSAPLLGMGREKDMQQAGGRELAVASPPLSAPIAPLSKLKARKPGFLVKVSVFPGKSTAFPASRSRWSSYSGKFT